MQASNKVISMERRSKVRYPLRTPVSYRTLDGLALTGEGEAVDMSSAGILVSSRHQLRVGSKLEVRIQWPPLLERRIPLQLITVGKVVRCEPSVFAVLFRQHQFRTMGSRGVQSPDQGECETSSNRTGIVVQSIR